MRFINSSKPILLVDDHQYDLDKLIATFGKVGVQNELVTAKHGEEALEILSKSKDLPCMILVDLRMPRVDGLEFLQALKQNSEFSVIPTIVVTGSEQEKDRIQSFELSASGYIVKTQDIDRYAERLLGLHNYWSLNELPV